MLGTFYDNNDDGILFECMLSLLIEKLCIEHKDEVDETGNSLNKCQCVCGVRF